MYMLMSDDKEYVIFRDIFRHKQIDLIWLETMLKYYLLHVNTGSNM